MNRDTSSSNDLRQAMHSVNNIKENVTARGQFLQPQDHSEEKLVQIMASETNKGVDIAILYDFTYCFYIRDSQQCLDRSSQNKNCVHSALSATLVSPRPLCSNGDPRRNLYVLGLPFDLTKSEFAKIFEPHGTVTHAVILATLDSASRRRGFIVMSTHQAAKAAMSALSRTQIKGHMLDVSWAVVQRSQGFLDGADRSMMLAVSMPSVSERDGLFPIPGGLEGRINDRWELTQVPTSKLMVSNLSTLLFTQVSDLKPLFYPFGPIKDIKIIGSSHFGSLNAAVTAMVEYVNVSNAQEAKEALQCQSYAGHSIETHYICDANTPVYTKPSSSPLFLGPFLERGKSPDLGLNPFAIPFSTDSQFPVGSPSQIYSPHHSTVIPNGLPSDAPLAPQPFLARMRPYLTDTISRSSSTTSSTWSHDCRPPRLSRTSDSSVNRANAYSLYA